MSRLAEIIRNLKPGESIEFSCVEREVGPITYHVRCTYRDEQVFTIDHPYTEGVIGRNVMDIENYLVYVIQENKHALQEEMSRVSPDS